MESFGYIAGLAAIVIGLSLTEAASGLYRLLRHGVIRSDPLIGARIVLLVMMLVAIWFDTWAIRGITSLYSYPFFLLIFGQLLLLYLMSASCVPTETASLDREPTNVLFWRVFVAYQLAYSALWLVFQTDKGFDLHSLVLRSYEVLVPLTVGLVLSVRRERTLHAIGVVTLIGFEIYSYWNARIG